MIVPQNKMNVVPQYKMNVEGGISGFTGTKVLAYWYKSTTKVLRLDASPEARWHCNVRCKATARHIMKLYVLGSMHACTVYTWMPEYIQCMCVYLDATVTELRVQDSGSWGFCSSELHACSPECV